MSTQLHVALCHRAGQRCQSSACAGLCLQSAWPSSFSGTRGHGGGRAGPLGLLEPLDLTVCA